MSDFGDRLTNLRENKGWSKTYVAKQLGISSMQTYANWEYGRTEPAFDMVTKLAELFNVTTDYLLGKPERSSYDKTVDELINQMQQYEGRPITDADRETIRGIIKGYLNVRPD